MTEIWADNFEYDFSSVRIAVLVSTPIPVA